MIVPVLLPLAPLYAPVLTVLVRDHRAGGLRKVITGLASISLVDKVPWFPGYVPPRQQLANTGPQVEDTAAAPIDARVLSDAAVELEDAEPEAEDIFLHADVDDPDESQPLLGRRDSDAASTTSGVTESKAESVASASAVSAVLEWAAAPPSTPNRPPSTSRPSTPDVAGAGDGAGAGAGAASPAPKTASPASAAKPRAKSPAVAPDARPPSVAGRPPRPPSRTRRGSAASAATDTSAGAVAGAGVGAGSVASGQMDDAHVINIRSQEGTDADLTPVYLRGRHLLNDTLEAELKTCCFESYPLYRGKAAGLGALSLSGKAKMKEVGRIKVG